jgi:hypothetical protein
MKNKLLLGLLGVLLIFGAGVYVGHLKIPATAGIDPQTYFSTTFTPYEDGTATYVAWLDQHGRKSLFVADYTFNNETVVDKYVELKTRYHSDVHVLLDLSESRSVATEQPAVSKLQAAGIEVVIGTSPKSGAIMHDKFSVGDGDWVEDGSWNYTDAADKQANVLNMNIVPSPQRGRLFKVTWDKLHDFMQQQQDRRAARANGR